MAEFQGISIHLSALSGTQSPSWSLSTINVASQPLIDKDEFKSFEIESSQISQIQLLFRSDWSGFEAKGQSSNEHTHNCLFNKSEFILFSQNEQSLFSDEIIPIKFFTPSQSISSSQISGILSQSWSHLYLESVQFFIKVSHKSTEFIWTVHWLTKAIHLLTSTEFVNNLSQALE